MKLLLYILQASDVFKLSPELLVAVLQRLDEAERLPKCAVVCQEWRAAVLRMPRSVQSSCCADMSDTEQWLAAHHEAAQVTSISFKACKCNGDHPNWVLGCLHFRCCWIWSSSV